MGKYLEDAKELLAAVGGKENIAAVSHCVTPDAVCAERPGQGGRAPHRKDQVRPKAPLPRRASSR